MAKQFFLLLLFTCFTSLFLGGQDLKPESLVFNLSSPDYAPFLIKEGPSGIMYDVLTSICGEMGIQVKSLSLPRNRVPILMEDGELDVTSRALEWETNPEKYVFSDSVIEIVDLLLSLKDHYRVVSNPEDLKGEVVGTILGFSYPELSTLFREHKELRDDTTTPGNVIKKILLKRNGFGIVNNIVAPWEFKTLGLDPQQFVLQQSFFKKVGYRFMFTRKWEPFLPEINKKLQKLKDTGKLDAILLRYK